MDKAMLTRILGAAAGIAAGALILVLGFWKAFLLIVLALLGWWISGGCKLPAFVRQILHMEEKTEDGE
ncbi:MAG: DUF2273 domain-containing protein [Clostridia bacterium]|nr:DUF2273 domain-containing protein [Clostridia bacterium]